jgi:hypothetical protein
MAPVPSAALGFRASDTVDGVPAPDAVIPAVKWSTFRRDPTGNLSPVQPGQIHAGDAIVLRLEPFADGQLSVMERLPDSATPRVVVATVRVERAKPLDTEPLTMDHPGVQELLVQFTPQPAPGGFAGLPAITRQATAPPPAQTILLRYR